MALFQGDMQQVVTPDGRTITMPSGLAAAFPSLQPAVPSAPMPVPLTPQDQQDLAAANAASQPEPTDAPITAPAQVQPPSDGPRAPQGPVTDPGAQPGPPNTPPPITNESLAKMGIAGGVNAELGAQDEQRSAARKQGEAIANQATAVGSQMAVADAHAQQLLEQRRQAAEANAAALQAKTDEYLRNAKTVADTKIDRSVDHPILAALGVALGGIGAAMAHRDGNPALDALYRAIDRKVAGQMQDLEQKRAGLGQQRDALGMQRQAGTDRLQEMDTYRLAYLEQARRKVETIKQQTTSDIVRANTDVVDAGLRQEQAKTVAGAQQRWQTQQDADLARKQTLQIAQMSNATAIRGQNIQMRENELNRAERAQEKLDAIAAQIAMAKGQDADKRAKEVKEQGILDPRTGDPLLTPAGADKMAQADQKEAQARAAKDPAQAQRLNEYAATLRQSAQLNDVATARDAKDREKVEGALESTHELALLADKAIEKLQAGPSAFDRQAWAGLQADLAVTKARYIATLKERVSVGALKAFESVLSIDPNSMFSRFADQGKALEALKALRADAATNANVVMKGAGIKSAWKPGLNTDQISFDGRTSQEIAADATPGGFRGDVEKRLGELGARTKMDAALEDANARTDAKGRVNSYGLDPADNEKINALIDQSSSVGHARYGDIAEKLAVPLTQDRPGIAGIARLIRDRDPGLYGDVMAKVAAKDPAKAQAITDSISVAQEMPKRSLSDLSDDERQQLLDQRRERATEADRAKYRSAYDARAAKGTRGQ